MSEKEKNTESQKNNNVKRLYRSEKDCMIGGVCGGIAEYFNIDSSIVRLIFVLIVFLGGSGILVYIILWIVLPTKSDVEGNREKTIESNVEEIAGKAEKFAKNVEKSSQRDESRMWLGVIIVVIGLLFLFDNFEIFNMFGMTLWHLWPLGLIILGFLILGRRN